MADEQPVEDLAGGLALGLLVQPLLGALQVGQSGKTARRRRAAAVRASWKEPTSSGELVTWRASAPRVGAPDLVGAGAGGEEVDRSAVRRPARRGRGREPLRRRRLGARDPWRDRSSQSALSPTCCSGSRRAQGVDDVAAVRRDARVAHPRSSATRSRTSKGRARCAVDGAGWRRGRRRRSVGAAHGTSVRLRDATMLSASPSPAVAGEGWGGESY